MNGDGTLTIYAITSTVGGSGDQGADPNKLVVITDTLSESGPTAPNTESFITLKSAGFGEVLRGVFFTPAANLRRTTGRDSRPPLARTDHRSHRSLRGIRRVSTGREGKTGV